MFSEFGFGAAGKISAIAFALSSTGVVSEGIQSRFGKRLAAGVGFEAARVVEVLIILALVCTGGALFVHQGISRIFEGVVLHGNRGGTHPFFVAETEDRRLLGASTGFAVVFGRFEARCVAVVVGKDQARLLIPVYTAVLVTVVPAFLCGHAFNERQITFPVLNAVLALLRIALEIKH